MTTLQAFRWRLPLAFLVLWGGLINGVTVAPGATTTRSEASPAHAGGVTELVSLNSQGEQGNGRSAGYAVSRDGRFVAFGSASTNLVAHDTNGKWDVFVRDRDTGRTERASVSTAGRQGNARSVVSDISADGRYVVFVSTASTLVRHDTNATTDVFLYDRRKDPPVRVWVGRHGAQGNGRSGGAAISAD